MAFWNSLQAPVRIESLNKQTNKQAKTLGDIKSHILDTHEYGWFLHLNMNRENYNEVEDNDAWITAESDEE